MALVLILIRKVLACEIVETVLPFTAAVCSQIIGPISSFWYCRKLFVIQGELSVSCSLFFETRLVLMTNQCLFLS